MTDDIQALQISIRQTVDKDLQTLGRCGIAEGNIIKSDIICP